MNHYKTHKNTRFSDSSQYDEVCEDCGLTDNTYAKKNLDNTPCSKAGEPTGLEILSTPMKECWNHPDMKTVGEYLVRLSHEVWIEGESFSGKRPFGNSGWHHDLVEPLASAFPDIVKAKWTDYADEEDDEPILELDDYDEKAFEKLINKAYETLYEFVNENCDS